MERVVVDSNVLVKWFIPEEYSDYAKLIRNDHLLGCIEVVAPRYALLEFYNALRKYCTRKVIDKEKLTRILDLFHEVKVAFIGVERSILDEALTYSLENHITVYDAYYIVLAYKLNTQVYTADEKLLKRIRDKEPRIKHLKEYKPRCSYQHV